MCPTHCPDLIHNPIKLHEDISYEAWTDGKQSKGPNSETNSYYIGHIVLIINTGIMKISLTVTELWPVKECLEENILRGITLKLIILMCEGHPDLIHIPRKWHEDIPTSN